MIASSTHAYGVSKIERIVRLVLGLALIGIAINVGLTSPGTEAKVVAWGALVLAVVAFASFNSGVARAYSRVGLDQNWSLLYLTARLFVGWEFLYAGWTKFEGNWYSGAGAGEVKGFLGGAVAGSHPTAQNAFPPVSHWFGWTADNVFVSHSSLLSYVVVSTELFVGIGLILGLLLRLSALFGVTLNALFLLSGSLSAGLNPEMIILGMFILLGVSPAVYALSLDRFLLPRLHMIKLPDRSAPVPDLTPEASA
jgi:thiosulfate dehydrogenase [quinone] large subunit